MIAPVSCRAFPVRFPERVRRRVDADPRAAAALLNRFRTGYGQWVAENAALSFGDGLPGCSIPQIEKEQTIRDWMGVSLGAAVAP